MGQAEDDSISVGKDSLTKINRNRYSKAYRITKTLMLIFAWISFGLNNEIIGPTYEDVRVQLSLNYNMMSTAVVLRLIGFLVMTPFSGALYDRLSNHAELIMSLSSFFMALPNFLIPITHNYVLILIWFLMQGVATAAYDLGGNHIVFGVWKGISSSPVNAMHSGYGIGAIIAVQIAKPFIKFDPFHEAREEERRRLNATSSSENATAPITSSDIDLRAPYSIAGAMGVLVAIIFLIAQFIETRNSKKFSERFSAQLESLNKMNETKTHQDDAEPPSRNSFVKRLLYGEKKVDGKALAYMLTQIVLIIILFVSLTGYITVISRFMLTYLTKGPANLSVNTFIKVQTLYWIFFVISRLVSSFLGHFNPVLFVLLALIANLAVCVTFLIPFIAQSELFFWIGMSLMGVTSGPLQPSAFMVAKTFVADYNSFVLSIFSVGMGLGAIIFQQISGALLDAFKGSYQKLLGFPNANESYIIAYLFTIPSAFCLFFYVIICLIYLKRNPNKK